MGIHREQKKFVARRSRKAQKRQPLTVPRKFERTVAEAASRGSGELTPISRAQRMQIDGCRLVKRGAVGYGKGFAIGRPCNVRTADTTRHFGEFALRSAEGGNQHHR